MIFTKSGCFEFLLLFFLIGKSEADYYENAEEFVSEQPYNINYVIDSIQSLKQSQEHLLEKVNILTRKLDYSENENYKLRLKLTRQITHLENQIFLVEQNLPKTINRFLNANFRKNHRKRNKLTVTTQRYPGYSNSDYSGSEESEENNLEASTTTTPAPYDKEMRSELNDEQDKVKSIKIQKLTNQQVQLGQSMNSLLNQFTGLKYDLENQIRDLRNSCSCLNEQAQNTAAMLRKTETTNKQQQEAAPNQNSEDATFHIITELFYLQKQIDEINQGKRSYRSPEPSPPSYQYNRMTTSPSYESSTVRTLETTVNYLSEEVRSHQEKQIDEISSRLERIKEEKITPYYNGGYDEKGWDQDNNVDPHNFTQYKNLQKIIKPRDCSQIKSYRARSPSGIYQIYPYGNETTLRVVCDMETSGGGWTVIQRRGWPLPRGTPMRENFHRDWRAYEDGFGDINSDFWLGLKSIYTLSHMDDQELRIEMTDWTGQSKYAVYSQFKIADSSEFFKIEVGEYQGTADLNFRVVMHQKPSPGDALGRHSGMPFSTPDRDNDADKRRHCARIWKGAWWYYGCHESNLNGIYANEGSNGVHEFGTGIIWFPWTGNYYSLRRVEMKIRNKFNHRE